jgi:hypothetical protein
LVIGLTFTGDRIAELAFWTCQLIGAAFFAASPVFAYLIVWAFDGIAIWRWIAKSSEAEISLFAGASGAAWISVRNAVVRGFFDWIALFVYGAASGVWFARLGADLLSFPLDTGELSFT